MYETQGASHIYKFLTSGQANGPGPVQVAITVASPGGGLEAEAIRAPNLSKEAGGYGSVETCVSQGCATGTVTTADKNNRAFFEIRALETSTAGFSAAMQEDPLVYIVQESGPTAQLDTSDEMLEGKPNGAFPSQWVNTTSASQAVLGVNAYDPGIGINAVGASSPGTSWGFAPKESGKLGCPIGGFLFLSHSVQCNECDQPECTGGKKGKTLSLPFTELGVLPEGEPLVEMKVQNATGLSATATGHIKVDNLAPALTVTTPSGEPKNETITEGVGSEYKVSASANSVVSPSSGVKSIAMTVDGREIGTPSSGCPAGPACVATGEWTVNTSQLGTGVHQLIVTTSDRAGNVASKTWTVTVRHGTPAPIGPGAVNLQSGEFLLGVTDAAVSGPVAGLKVERFYRSRHLTAGAEGPLGPQWSISVGGQESITRLPNGSVTLTSSDGGQSIFVPTGGGKFSSPPGDANLSLTEAKNEQGEPTEYVLRAVAQAATTRFTSLTGPGATLWKPTKQEGPLASQTVRYIYQTAEGITEPKYALAPEPGGLSFSCYAKLEKAEALEKGCRALEFKYASKTTAEGNNEPEWGDYKGRLQQVVLLAYSPAAKAMAGIPVSQYSFDATGRLRAQWNPQISPALKTTYGYDTENHVTAVTLPNQQPWLLNYGTVAGRESSTADGYLLSITRPAAATKLGVGSLPVLKTAPKIPAKPKVGKAVKASTGSWLDGPLAYSFQWLRCAASGTECHPIGGAVNQEYIPATEDQGHALEVEVTAYNGSGARNAASIASEAVKAGTPSGALPEPPEPGTQPRCGRSSTASRCPGQACRR